MTSGVRHIVGNWEACAAVKGDGSVVTCRLWKRFSLHAGALLIFTVIAGIGSSFLLRAVLSVVEPKVGSSMWWCQCVFGAWPLQPNATCQLKTSDILCVVHLVAHLTRRSGCTGPSVLPRNVYIFTLPRRALHTSTAPPELPRCLARPRARMPITRPCRATTPANRTNTSTS